MNTPSTPSFSATSTSTLEAMLQRARVQQRVIARVATDPAVLQGDITTVARLITESVAHLLNIGRVGVWLFNDRKDELHNVDNYVFADRRHESGAVLAQSAFHDEFQYFLTEKYVDAHDPYTDARTKGYVEVYLKPNNITSMLDAVVRAGNELIGTLCFEHVGQAHTWQEDEITFASQLGDQIALTITNKRRVESEQALEKLNAQLEARVAQRTAELSAINEELESFSYSVSHDLRAPLRTIEGFGSMLKETAWDKLDDDERDSLSRILAQSSKMNGLINDLLRLAKTSQLPMQLTTVDVSALCQQWFEQLRQQHLERHIEFSITPSIELMADKNLLSIAFENVLSNALKFTRDRDPATISVNIVKDDQGCMMIFRDNGAGFDPTYKDRLCKPFQRLHRVEEFDGIGIGLATVRRIMLRHNGSVDVDGQVNQGATVTLRFAGN